MNIRPLIQELRSGRVNPVRLAEALDQLQRYHEKVDQDQKTTAAAVEELPDTILDNTPPGDVTFGTPVIEFTRHKVTSQPMLKITIPVTPPDPLGTYAGYIAYLEAPDGSGSTPRKRLGEFTLGTDALNKDFSPEIVGVVAYDPDYNELVFEYEPPMETETWRVYCPSYSAALQNDILPATDEDAPPSVTFEVSPPSAWADGEEYAKNVTNFDVVNVQQELGGVLNDVLTVTFTKPDDRAWSGLWITLVYPNGEESTWGVIRKSGEKVWYPAGDTPQSVTVYGRSFSETVETSDPSDDKVNTIVPGVTPSKLVVIGTAVGVINLAKAAVASVGAAMNILNQVLDVKAGGITEDLVAQFAISRAKIKAKAVGTLELDDLAVGTAHIQALAVTNALIANLAVNDAKISDLSAAKITAGTLIAGVIYSGTINVNQLNAGELTSQTLLVTANGFTTHIANGYDSTLGNYNGIIVKLTATGQVSGLSPTDLRFAQPSVSYGAYTATTIDIGSVGGSTGRFYVSCGTQSSLTLSGNSTTSLQILATGTTTTYINLPVGGEIRIFGNNVVRQTQAAVSNPSGGSVIDVECRAALSALLSRLRSSTGHGLISG